MSDPDRKRPSVLLAIGKGLCFILLAFFGLVVLSIIGLGAVVEASFEILWHLATGFVRFLQTNLGKISSDAGTWGPGLAAFLLALVVIHWFGATWARRRNRTWRISNAVAFGMLLPLLFVISFLVPGAMLQIGNLRQGNWFQGNRSDKASKVMHARNIAQAAHAWANLEEADRFPPSTAAMISKGFFDVPYFRPQSVGDNPGEPPLYLGTGLTPQSDPALPLVISDIYSSKNRTRHRTVITVGSEFVEIRPEEVDEWIARAIAAREGAKP
jgi:hypothetical protein